MESEFIDSHKMIRAVGPTLPNAVSTSTGTKKVWNALTDLDHPVLPHAGRIASTGRQVQGSAAGPPHACGRNSAGRTRPRSRGSGSRDDGAVDPTTGGFEPTNPAWTVSRIRRVAAVGTGWCQNREPRSGCRWRPDRTPRRSGSSTGGSVTSGTRSWTGLKRLTLSSRSAGFYGLRASAISRPGRSIRKPFPSAKRRFGETAGRLSGTG